MACARLRDSLPAFGAPAPLLGGLPSGCWRRRSQAPREPIVAKVDTVYQCPMCEVRFIGEQYCEECHSFARRLGPAAPVLAVMSRSQSPSSSSRTVRGAQGSKDDTREVIREQDRRKGAAIPSTGIDYFSLGGRDGLCHKNPLPSLLGVSLCLAVSLAVARAQRATR